MYSVETLKKQIDSIEEKLSLVFENKELLVTALVHRSYINEHRDAKLQHNERLEFLGDSVLGLIVAEYLFHRLPEYPEGHLSQLRSRIVDANTCATFLQKLGVHEFILLGRGEALRGRTKLSILADAFEALLGAIFLDQGFNVTKSFVLVHFETDFEATIDAPTHNYKAELQDFSQRHFQKIPVYKVLEETGPQHAKTFRVHVFVNDIEAGSGIGYSKKEAEQRAALDALSKKGL